MIIRQEYSSNIWKVMGIGLVEENRIVSMSEYKVASIVVL
jgi:hypothetical protein